MVERVEETLMQMVRASELLPMDDRDKLLEQLSISYGHANAILKHLSIFAPPGKQELKNNFQSWIYDSEKLFYLTSNRRSHCSFFVTNERKIIFQSRYYFTHLHEFCRHIDHFLRSAFAANLEAAIDVGGNFVAIEKWFMSYGHFKDEAYSLGEFIMSEKNDNEVRALLDYPTDSGLDQPNFRFNVNYQIISKLIFGSRAFNAYDLQATTLSMTKLRIFENGFHSPIFHHFPMKVARRIGNQVKDAWTGDIPRRLMLTRSKSYRDITNKFEVEAFLQKAGFTIIDPEKISYAELVSISRNTSEAVMYYGSAMTNMVYFPEFSKIIILKSNSYMEESIDLWMKVITAYSIELTVLDSKNNIIELDELAQLIVS